MKPEKNQVDYLVDVIDLIVTHIAYLQQECNHERIDEKKNVCLNCSKKFRKVK